MTDSKVRQVLNAMTDDELLEHIGDRLHNRLNTPHPEGDDCNRLASRIHEGISSFVSCSGDVPLVNQPIPPERAT